jgi:ankyrin repeat protein
MARPETWRAPLPAALILLCALCTTLPSGIAATAKSSSTLPENTRTAVLDPARLAIRQKDFAAAQSRLEKLAQQGNADAAYLLGSLLLANPSGDPDPNAAKQWLQQAAQAGRPRADYLLAVIAATVAPLDETEARRRLQLAAQGNVAEAQQLQRENRLPYAFLPAVDLQEQEARAAAALRAARVNDVAALQRLAVEPAMVQVRDEFNRDLLAIAAASDAVDAAAWLLRNGGKPESQDAAGATALLLAARAPKGAVVGALLAAKVHIAAVDRAGNNALHLAAASGDVTRVTQLLAAKVPVNEVNQDGDRPMDIALRRTDKPLADVLRAAGAEASRPATVRNVSLTDVQRAAGNADAYAGRSDLDVAAGRRDVRLLKSLLAKGAYSAAQKNSALLSACESGLPNAVTVLLGAGADRNASDARQRRPVSIAVQQNNAAVLDVLLTAGAPAGVASASGTPVLIEAVIAGHTALIGPLLAHGALVDAVDATGRTALMWAALQDDASMLDQLLARKPDIARRDRSGRDALMHAAANSSAGTLRRLLAAGANPRTADPEGHTALGEAATRGTAEGVQVLLTAGANVNARARNDTSVLMQAAGANRPEAVRVLLRAGADVGLRDSQGETALTLAARDAAPEVVKALLDAGADRAIRNNNRVNAGDIAENLHRQAVLALLSK